MQFGEISIDKEEKICSLAFELFQILETKIKEDENQSQFIEQLNIVLCLLSNMIQISIKEEHQEKLIIEIAKCLRENLKRNQKNGK